MSNVGVCISVIFLLKREVDATQTQTTPNRPLAPIIPLCLCDTGSNTCKTVASITWQDDWWANLLREEEIKTERLRRSESWVTESQSGKKNSGLSLRCSPYKVQRDTHTLQLLCVIVSFFISLRLAVGTASSNAKFPPSFESLLSLILPFTVPLIQLDCADDIFHFPQTCIFHVGFTVCVKTQHNSPDNKVMHLFWN